MISLPVLREMFDHNYWARDVQLRACKALTPEQLLQPMGGSFGSLRDTLVHLLGVECLWMERWQGASPKEMLHTDAFPTLDSITAFWQKTEERMRQMLDSLDEKDLQQDFTYTNMKGEKCTYLIWRMLIHFLMHQSTHRGQVNTLLRQLGAEAVTVDFLKGFDAGYRCE